MRRFDLITTHSSVLGVSVRISHGEWEGDPSIPNPRGSQKLAFTYAPFECFWRGQHIGTVST